MSKTQDWTETLHCFLSGCGIRHSLVIQFFVISHSSANFDLKVSLSNYLSSFFRLKLTNSTPLRSGTA